MNNDTQQTTSHNSKSVSAKKIIVAADKVPAEQPLNSDSTTSQAVDNRLGEFPALARLRLADGDWDELRHQGSVSTERRGKVAIHKLRFRRGGKQVVRYIGDGAAAAEIRRELESLQSQRQIFRDLAALDRDSCRFLRDSKLQLEPLIAAYRLKFHGRDFRRPHLTN